MLVFGTQVHIVTFIFILLEASMLVFQAALYFLRPQELNRLLYLLLLFLMLFYNITGGLFPDPSIKMIPVNIQEMIAYGSGFLMASYFPYYFYQAFNLKQLRWHALYGVPLFLFLPYLIFFVIVYSINGNLNVDIRYGMIVPFAYALVLLWVMFKAIHYQNRELKNKKQYLDELFMYLAVSPWAALAFFGLVEESQLFEVLCTNTGIVAITFIYFRKMISHEHDEHRAFQEAVLKLRNRQDDFEQQAKSYGYSRRETEIVLLLCQGLTYKAIGDRLFISENTVDNTVQKIYSKTGVKSKLELIRKLGF
ncbi:regulatory protein, luxR family [Mucilaginibacter gossypii]|uniref:Regulatory protein, luxR family n=3 Tax=Mucilaginibacter TaxID=423349 RepID=A0A1G8D5N4_9SPHI|nr:regulatory protein, luxR family [Mucilaginibacter gossypii]